MREYFIWLAKLVTFCVIILVGVPALVALAVAAAAGASKGLETQIVESNNKVAVVEVKGIIENVDEILEDLHDHVDDDSIDGIVLAVDSPGGAVGPSQAIYSAVSKLKAKKPIVASMGTVAASGGLYVSLGASKVLCQPGTLTGSIGVILQIPNLTQIASKVGFDMVTIKSGDLKDAGNAFRTMTEKDRSFLQATVDVAHEDFIQAVAEGRGLDRQSVLEFADGRIILGSQAKEFGLVDGFGDMYEAGRAVYDILGTPLDEGDYPELVVEKDKYEEIRRILSSIVSIPSALGQHVRLMYLLQ